jgi:hypothetical protein
MSTLNKDLLDSLLTVPKPPRKKFFRIAEFFKKDEVVIPKNFVEWSSRRLEYSEINFIPLMVSYRGESPPEFDRVRIDVYFPNGDRMESWIIKNAAGARGETSLQTPYGELREIMVHYQMEDVSYE